MKLQFLGANRQVTGSRYCLEADGTRILVDCGMFQERKYLARNWEPSPVPPKRLDALLLTHAHIDHCGLVPKLVSEGFRGPIYTTAASADLVEVVLRDAAKIQMEDAAFKKKRHRKEGRKAKHPVVPLLTDKDVNRALALLKPVPYREPVAINDHVSVAFHDAGHILGSAMIELNVRVEGKSRRLIFSGDIGQWDKPIIRDPSIFTQADFVVMESTYGTRKHAENEDVELQLAKIVNRTVEAGGNVVIPTFAIERAQELVYHIGQLTRDKRIPHVPVYLDSPMAAEVTDIFRRHRDCFDAEAWELITAGNSPLRFPGLRMARTTEESKAINRLEHPAIVMATSGMCTAGRIKHHLIHNVERPECTVLFVGYQAEGTLGRQIRDGNAKIRIHGRHWDVRARVEQIDGFSGHADSPALMRWLSCFRCPPRQLFLTHGDYDQSRGLAEKIHSEHGWDVSVPEYRQTAELK